MRNIRKILALLLTLFLTAALCGCAASRMDDGLAGTSGSDSVKPADATDFMSYAGPIFPLTLAQAEKVVGVKQFNELLKDYIVKKPGKPALAKESDKRPAISGKPKAIDIFENI